MGRNDKKNALGGGLYDDEPEASRGKGGDVAARWAPRSRSPQPVRTGGGSRAATRDPAVKIVANHRGLGDDLCLLSALDCITPRPRPRPLCPCRRLGASSSVATASPPPVLSFPSHQAVGGGAWGNANPGSPGNDLGPGTSAASGSGAPGSPAAPPPAGGGGGGFMSRLRRGGNGPTDTEMGASYAFSGGDEEGGGGGGSGGGGGGGDSGRSARLDERERDLERRERALAAREGAVRDAQPNWPFFCKVYRHDIDRDLPPASRPAVRAVYWSLLLGAFCMLVQAVLATLALGVVGADVLWEWMVSVLILLTGGAGMVVLWYMRLYRAAARDKTSSFLVFFTFYFVHLGFSALCAAGPPLSGTSWFLAGYITASKALKVERWLGYAYFVGAGLWTCEVLVCFWAKSKVVAFWRGQGGPEAARQDIAAAQAAARGAAAAGRAGMGSGLAVGGGVGGGNGAW